MSTDFLTLLSKSESSKAKINVGESSLNNLKSSPSLFDSLVTEIKEKEKEEIFVEKKDIQDKSKIDKPEVKEKPESSKLVGKLVDLVTSTKQQEIKPEVTKPEVTKPEVTKPETKPELTKAVPKEDIAKPEIKQEIKPEVKPEVKPELTKTVPKEEVIKPELTKTVPKEEVIKP
ncbi:MAG: hypothetical protein U9Q20_01100, partial [Campylobacterota bacterium]|nr:hypothetical protein [Campylobacterota bacterium]